MNRVFGNQNSATRLAVNHLWSLFVLSSARVLARRINLTDIRGASAIEGCLREGWLLVRADDQAALCGYCSNISAPMLIGTRSNLCNLAYLSPRLSRARAPGVPFLALCGIPVKLEALLMPPLDFAQRGPHLAYFIVTVPLSYTET